MRFSPFSHRVLREEYGANDRFFQPKTNIFGPHGYYRPQAGRAGRATQTTWISSRPVSWKWARIGDTVLMPRGAGALSLRLGSLLLFHPGASGFEDFALAWSEALNAVGGNLIEDGIDFVTDKIFSCFFVDNWFFALWPR